MDCCMIEDVEKMSYNECTEKIDKPQLLCQLNRVLETNLFYRRKYEHLKMGTRIDFDMFLGLPFTTKEDVLIDQKTFPPYGRLVNGDMTAKLRRVHITSGSTGRPLYIFLSDKDIESTVVAGRRAFRCAGLTNKDTVIHCLNYCLWAGGLTDHLNLESTGATVIPFGVGHSKRLIQTILELKPTAISCTPSYLSKLEYLINSEFDMIPANLGLSKALLGAEGGLQNLEYRSRIENVWGLKAIDANYGMADVLSIFGSECEARNGLHFHGQGIVYLELIDPNTAQILDIEDGKVGEMVLTNLCREAQPLMRYRTSDLIKIVSTQRCSCGRDSIRFLVLGRTDDMVTIRGINVYPEAIGGVLAKWQDLFSGEYEMVIDTPPPIERPLLRIELSRANPDDDYVKLQNFVIDICQQEFNFTPRVVILPFGQFPRTEGKTRRLKKIV